jgi:hypothetical protein
MERKHGSSYRKKGKRKDLKSSMAVYKKFFSVHGETEEKTARA